MRSCQFGGEHAIKPPRISPEHSAHQEMELSPKEEQEVSSKRDKQKAESLETGVAGGILTPHRDHSRKRTPR